MKLPSSDAHPVANGSDFSALATAPPRVVLWCATFAVVNYFALVVAYLLIDTFFNFAEPGGLVVTALFATGRPLYLPVDSAIQTNFAYGPTMFLFGAVAMHIFGFSIFAGKLAAGAFALLGVVCVLEATRSRLGVTMAMVAAGLLVSIYGLFWPFLTFIARSDAYILGAVGLGLWAATLHRAPISALIMALAIGIAANSKLHAGIYFFPMLVLQWSQHGWRTTFLACLGSLLVFAAPFLLLENISAAGLYGWLKVVARNDFLWINAIERTRQAILWLGFPSLMVLAVLKQPGTFLREWRWFGAALCGSLLLGGLVSLHQGSYQHHIIPVAIPLSFMFAHGLAHGLAIPSWRQGDWRARMRLGWATLMFVVMIVNLLPADLRMARLWSQEARLAPAAQDVQDVLKRYPQVNIGMGYGVGEHSQASWWRPLLALAGRQALIEVSTAYDINAAGLDFPPATIAALRECKIPLWLLPKGSDPFYLINGMGGQPTFSETFRQTFLDRYERTDVMRQMELWRCKS